MRRLNIHSFDDVIKAWIPLTVALNSMNRTFGLTDCYPFVLTTAAIDKLRFVHDLVEEQRARLDQREIHEQKQKQERHRNEPCATEAKRVVAAD